RIPDALDRPAVGALLHRAVVGAHWHLILLFHDPAPGRAARKREPGPADQHPNLSRQPLDSALRLSAGNGLPLAASLVPDGAALPAAAAPPSAAGDGRVPRGSDAGGGLLLPPRTAAAAPDRPRPHGQGLAAYGFAFCRGHALADTGQDGRSAGR